MITETITAGLPHELNRAWCAAFNAGDLEQLRTMYEPDAVLVPGPGAETLSGAAASSASSASSGRSSFGESLPVQ